MGCSLENSDLGIIFCNTGGTQTSKHDIDLNQIHQRLLDSHIQSAVQEGGPFYRAPSNGDIVQSTQSSWHGGFWWIQKCSGVIWNHLREF